jgi:hypothetical protein
MDEPPPPPSPLPPERVYRGISNPETGVLDFALSHGWKSFTGAWGLLVVAGLAVFASGLPAQFAGQFVGPWIRAANPPPEAIVLAVGLLVLLGTVWSILVQWPVAAGAMVAAAEAARGRTAAFGALGAGFRRLGPTLLSTLLVWLITVLATLPLAGLALGGVFVTVLGARRSEDALFAIGLVVVVIAGIAAILVSIWLTARLVLAPARAADPALPRVGGLEAVRISWNATRGHALSVLGVLILGGLVSLAGFLCCCVGLPLFGFPLFYAWLGALYVALVDPTSAKTVDGSAADPWLGDRPPLAPR